MILVVGGTGALGSAAAERLLAKGKSVRVMTRTPAKAEALQALGAEIIQGDLRDKASLIRACKGVESILAAAHSILGRGSEASKYVDDRGHKWLIDSAKDAKVKRFIYTSGIGCAPNHPAPFLRIKYEVEQYLKKSGLEYVILRPTAFMESHAYMFIGQPILETGKVSLFGKGENPRNFVAADDAAKFALIALETPETTGQILSFGGPEDLTNMQVVALFEELAGQKAKVSHVPLTMLRIMSPLLKPFHPGLSQIMKMSIIFDTTDQTFDMSETLQRYPVDLTPITKWVHDYVPKDAIPVTT